MSQIRSFLMDSLAYVLANRKLGHRITDLSKEMVRLRDTELSMSSIIISPDDSIGKMRGGHNMPIAREILKESKDPRYIKNPLYSPNNHRKANGHHLFDEIKKPDAVTEQPKSALLRKGTMITASGIEFELKENTKVLGSQSEADKVMTAQSENYGQA